MCILRVCIAACDHCDANVTALGGRSKPERLCALLFATTALLMLPHWGAGVNRNACVHFACVRFAAVLRVFIAACDHCAAAAANVAALGGRSKPERLCAFFVCALLFVTTALLMLPHWGAGVNRNACVHFACVRFACVHCCLWPLRC